MYLQKSLRRIIGALIALYFWGLFPPAQTHTLSFLKEARAGFFNNDLETFEDVLLLVSKNYVYAPDYEKLFSSAIQSMAEIIDSRDTSIEFLASNRIQIQEGKTTHSFRLGPNMEEDFQAFKKIFYLLNKISGGSPSKKRLETASMEGLMGALDPYSQYLNEDAFERSMRDTEGQYGGLGMVITMEDYKLTVLKIMKDSPAAEAGIHVNDIIINVNGKQIKGMQIDDLATMLRGHPKTKVTLTVFRPITGKHKVHTLTREVISVQTVDYRKIEENTGYIKIASFSKQTNEQLESILRQAQSDQVKGFILDLRNNPGGLLDQSVKVASHFLKRGRLVVFTQGRKENDRDEYRAHYKNSLSSYPVTILLNQHSASASEIVAGALRDSGRALILGETSYGKGSVQTIFRIRENVGIRLTTSKYYTPSGVDISEHGIVPEIRIIEDLTSNPEEEKSTLNKIPDPNQIKRSGTLVNFKRSDVEKYLKENRITVTDENDFTILLASMIVKRSLGSKNKILALEKARELAANIHY